MNMDEFAMGSSTENSSAQVTRNPWDLSRVPGGSSGGSAAALAADTAFGALGSDTGGSIRQPAALSGIVGFKPSYGRVSRFGLVAFASSFDQIGPLTKTVRDSALLMNAIAGHDSRDSTSLNALVPDYTANLGRDLKGIRVGLPKEYMIEGVDPVVKSAVMAAVKQLESLGAEIVEASLPHTDYAISVYYILATAEASANLARFDGVRYGHRAEKVSTLFEHYARTRAEGFGAEVKRRIILGTYVLSSGYYDAYYLRAQKVRELIRQDFVRAFEKVEALVSPTSPGPAFKLGEKTTDPLQMYLADVFTNAANLAGICGISLPCGFAESENGKKLPIGLQLLGKALNEARAHFDFVVAQHAGVDSVHQVFKRVDIGAARSERAHCRRHLHRYAFCLVELSSRPTEPGFARAHARCFSQLAPRPRNLSRRHGRARGRDQSVSFACHFLSCLSPLLDGRDLARNCAGYPAFPFTNSISRLAPDLERRPRLATRDAAL